MPTELSNVENNVLVAPRLPQRAHLVNFDDWNWLKRTIEAIKSPPWYLSVFSGVSAGGFVTCLFQALFWMVSGTPINGIYYSILIACFIITCILVVFDWQIRMNYSGKDRENALEIIRHIESKSEIDLNGE